MRWSIHREKEARHDHITQPIISRLTPKGKPEHHVRALKKLTGKTEAERLMLHMRRKSLALCPYCYQSTLAQEP